MNEIVLSTDNLCKNYNGRNVVDRVSLTVKKGDVYGFVGLNGAGKTTLMRMVAGLITPSDGGFSLFGKSGTEINAARKRTAAIIESPVFYPGLTGLENVSVYLGLLGGDKKRAGEYLEMAGLSPNIKTKAKGYSLGMKQRLSIAMALSTGAEFMLLDEPTNGLDPEGMYEIRTLLKRLNEQNGVTILISSHILSELSKLATTYGFIHNGKLIKEISGKNIEASIFKCQVVETSDPVKTFGLFKNHAVITGSRVEITGNFSAGEIIKKLTENGIETLSINTRQADLEDYFRSLIGGAAHD